MTVAEPVDDAEVMVDEDDEQAVESLALTYQRKNIGVRATYFRNQLPGRQFGMHQRRQTRH